MKKHLLLCAIVTSAISVNSLAAEMYKATVVNHKEWSTGNIKVAFKPASALVSVEKMNQFKKLNDTDDQQINVGASAINASAVAGKPIDGSAFHFIYLTNNSQTNQEYNFTLGVCVVVDPNNSQCGYYQQTVDIQPGGYFISTQEPSVELTINQPGVYPTSASAILYKSGNAYMINSVGMGTLTITNPAMPRA